MDDWIKFIPCALFTAKDGSPMHVILDILDDSKRKVISEMIESRGGSITYSSPSPFAIILTNRKKRNSRYSKYPVFDVKWIMDCIESVELIDINPYLIENEKFEGRNFMDVIYHKLETSDGTLVVDEYKQFKNEQKIMEGKKPAGKNRRRGPPKKEDHVHLVVDLKSNEDDFYNALAASVLSKRIESILLNERSLSSTTKDQLKKYDSGLENRLCSNESLSSFQSYNSNCRSMSVDDDDDVPQTDPTFSATGKEEHSNTRSRSSSNEASNEFLVGPQDCAELMGNDSFKQITKGKKLQCTTNALPLSSRVQGSLPKTPDELPDSPNRVMII